MRPPLLAELETAVMNHLWNGRDGEAKAVHATLGKRRGITLNTVPVDAQAAVREASPRTRQSEPRARVLAQVSRERFHSGLIGELVSDLLDHHADSVVAAFVDVADRAGSETLARLAAMVSAPRRAREKG